MNLLSLGFGAGLLAAGCASKTPARAVTFPSGWKLFPDAVHAGQYGCASDPSLLPDPSGLRMYYTGLDPESNRTVLCLATSPDGRRWTETATDRRIKGLILAGTSGAWDENLESAFAIRAGGEVRLYYSGYRDKGDPMKGFPAALGLAVSTDGVTFRRRSAAPLLSPEKDGFDAHAVYSPVVVKAEGGYAMVYCGHAYAGKRVGVRLLGATSRDGLSWKRLPRPVLEGAAVGEWTRDGVAEPALVRDGDSWWLFFTGLKDEERAIGVAKGPSPLGPWKVERDPILRPTPGAFADRQLLAPSVLLEKGRARMWLLGTRQGSEEIRVGYAERAWPPR